MDLLYLDRTLRFTVSGKTNPPGSPTIFSSSSIFWMNIPSFSSSVLTMSGRNLLTFSFPWLLNFYFSVMLLICQSTDFLFDDNFVILTFLSHPDVNLFIIYTGYNTHTSPILDQIRCSRFVSHCAVQPKS